MNKIINISIQNKIAYAAKDACYVCGNNDFKVVFTFDDEWDETSVKTARFVYNGVSQEVVFQGTECPVPFIVGATYIDIGVYTSNGLSSTPARTKAKESILCIGEMPDAPKEDVYNQIVGLCDKAVRTAQSVEDRANAGEFTPVVGVDYFTDDEKATMVRDVADLMPYSIASGYIIIPKSAWRDDSDLYIDKDKSMRISYTNNGHHEYIINQNYAIVNEGEWSKLEGTFVYNSDSDKDFIVNFFGGKSAYSIQPYDIADIKICLASEPDVNLIPNDITDLDWTIAEGNKFAVAFEDGLKYIHVWRQLVNTAAISANTGIRLTPGEEYIFECRLRMTCKQLYYTVPFNSVEASSSTLITPTKSSTAECVERAVFGFAQGVNELAFTAESKPSSDLTLMVSVSSGGSGGIMMNNHLVLRALLEIANSTQG